MTDLFDKDVAALAGNPGSSLDDEDPSKKDHFRRPSAASQDQTHKERRPSVMFNPPAKFLSEEEKAADAAPEEEWTFNHTRLLYLVSLYAKCARSPSDNEGWVRQVPLSVMMYEGIVAGALDFDYAPCSMLVSHLGASRRIWLNITQEGKAAIDDLREKGMINGLKLSTEDFQPVTAYQVSEKGMTFLDIVPKPILAVIDAFARPHGEGDIVKVSFDGEEFGLKSNTGSVDRESGITETEDVSYVSSPYLPECLREGGGKATNELSDNQFRAHECASGKSNLKDELSEAIILGSVHCLVSEWIPFGANQIVMLNERLGALDRVQGGLFTAMVDTKPSETGFAVPPGLTSVSILEFDFVNFINFEAEINCKDQ